ncbi:dehydrodolichyl diphosphate synthase complex subunit Nus1 [Toxorhynchites rutilus septentrionalis]|uniref:dehydrodolichyl diphosphate synthase complex subunit Nus1 n=1 Tax=Toxorhynchites rutilus septentrionalis TaxID=329112 RepID=UPI00247A1973|nr:dehydrodolichyl diphosphate synthase complex subunit Nus1 [Toxorhynchites rutilus septentrionalis]
MSSKPQLSNSPAGALLLLVHLLCSLVERVFLAGRWIRQKFGILRRKNVPVQGQPAKSGEYRSTQQLQLDSDSYISYGVRKLEKIPSHLVVMLGPEIADYEQLANFVFWGMAAGVGHVSFYDHRGTLKRNHHQMLNYVSKRPRGDSEQIVWTPQLKTSNGFLPPRNGYRRRVVVSFYSLEDGKHQLASTARTIASALRNRFISAPAEVTIEMVNRKLQHRYHQVPDPELAVYFGNILSTYGMLPWQIRLTEFVRLDVGSLAELNAGHFLKCLYQYAKCEQRFGK